MAHIRAYQPMDESDIIHIFSETAHSELQEAGPTALHYASYNWARPYIMLVPEHCIVVDDGTGKAVGYLFGVPDTQSFVSDYRERYLPHLESQGLTNPKEQTITDGGEKEDVALAMRRITWRPEDMLVNYAPNLLLQYPAHLHIDILPSHQGQGWGRQMIELILHKFGDLGVQGFHLGKVGSNFGAGKFYAKLGFSRFPEVMDGGKSGEVGRTSDGGIYLVKSLR